MCTEPDHSSELVGASTKATAKLTFCLPGITFLSLTRLLCVRDPHFSCRPIICGGPSQFSILGKRIKRPNDCRPYCAKGSHQTTLQT